MIPTISAVQAFLDSDANFQETSFENLKDFGGSPLWNPVVKLFGGSCGCLHKVSPVIKSQSFINFVRQL